MSPFHPFVPPFEYDAGLQTIYDSESTVVVHFQKQQGTVSHTDRTRIGHHIAELMNASAALAEHEEKV